MGVDVGWRGEGGWAEANRQPRTRGGGEGTKKSSKDSIVWGRRLNVPSTGLAEEFHAEQSIWQMHETF